MYMCTIATREKSCLPLRIGYNDLGAVSRDGGNRIAMRPQVPRSAIKVFNE